MKRPAPRLLALALLVLAASFSMGQSCGAPLTLQATGTDLDDDLVPDWADNCVDAPNRSQRNTNLGPGEVCVGSDPQPDKANSVPSVYGSCANDGSECLMDVDCHRGDACDCDFDADGQCNIDDFNLLLAAQGTSAVDGTDMNDDGIVDAADFALFEPLFSAGRPGRGSADARVTELSTDPLTGATTRVEGACFDTKWSRLLYPSSGRASGGGLSCSVSTNRALDFLLTPNKRQALTDDPDNPTNALLAIRGQGANQCPNAAFSTGDKTNPRACDGHDLCGSRCGRNGEDCNAQFYRNLFHTCELLTGQERTDCRADCLDFATYYATAIATGSSSIPVPILAPPWDDPSGGPSKYDLLQDELNCLCTPPVCRRNSDCAVEANLGASVTCEAGYCVQKITGVGCAQNSDCANGYLCQSGDCVWDPQGPDRLALDLAPPTCGDGLCEVPLESCMAKSCREDCGSCALGDLCELNRDCGEGGCLNGTCQPFPDGAACNDPAMCKNGSCLLTSPVQFVRQCSSTCTLDEECGSGVCHLFQCVPPLAVGLLCDDDSDCESGLCAGVCLADDLDPGTLCLRDGQCASGTCTAGFCQGNCGDGFCTVVPNGETCFSEGCQADCGQCPSATPGCDEDADCAGGLCGGGVCLNRASIDPGSVCLFDAECTSGNCTAGLCDGSCGDGFCTLLPAGEGCLTCAGDCGLCGNGSFGCVIDAQCASGDCRGGFCGGVPNGNTCIANNQCASGVCNNAFCVNPDSVGLGGICTTSLACGSGTCTAGLCVCDSNSDCPSGRSCVAAVCITTPTCASNGTTCLLNSACCSGRCDDVPPVCRAKLSNGSSCNENSDCLSGDCGDCNILGTSCECT